MYQDIYSQIDHTLLQHQQNAPTGHGSHFVQIQNDSLLQKLSKTDKIKVNSRHHQANRRVPKPLVISGRSNDGIIEAVESEEDRKSTRLNSSHVAISYAVFCLKKKIR